MTVHIFCSFLFFVCFFLFLCRHHRFSSVLILSSSSSSSSSSVVKSGRTIGRSDETYSPRSLGSRATGGDDAIGDDAIGEWFRRGGDAVDLSADERKRALSSFRTTTITRKRKRDDDDENGGGVGDRCEWVSGVFPARGWGTHGTGGD